MNTSLYALASEYEVIAEKLMESDLDEQTIKDTLESVSGDLETKAVNVAMFIRNLESGAEQIKLAKKAMDEREKKLQSKADSIKQYLFDNMKRVGITKIDSPYFSLSIKKNPPKLIIDNADNIPEQYMITPPPPPKQIDNAAIKEALKNGADVDGAHLEQGERLEIK
jgi:hypothetical protein